MKTIEIYTSDNLTLAVTASGSEAANVAIEAATTHKIAAMLLPKTSAYDIQYPNSGYAVTKLDDKNLRVTCPDHGAFTISKTNFTYLRGCNLCRGLHPRAYPLQSPRKSTGTHVYMNAEGFASLTNESAVYAVSIVDKRVAALVPSMLQRIAESYGFEFAKGVLTEIARFQVKPHHFESTKFIAQKTVALGVDGTVYPPDSDFPDTAHVSYYRKRLEAEIVYHLISRLPAGNFSAAMALLNPTKV